MTTPRRWVIGGTGLARPLVWWMSFWKLELSIPGMLGFFFRYFLGLFLYIYQGWWGVQKFKRVTFRGERVNTSMILWVEVYFNFTIWKTNGNIEICYNSPQFDDSLRCQSLIIFGFKVSFLGWICSHCSRTTPEQHPDFGRLLMDPQHPPSWFTKAHTVDGRNPAKQLRLVVYTIIYRSLYIPGGAAFVPPTVLRCAPLPLRVGNERLIGHENGLPEPKP